MAEETAMLAVYRKGSDIHAATAAIAMGITDEAFAALPDAVKKEKRQPAKPF